MQNLQKVKFGLVLLLLTLTTVCAAPVSAQGNDPLTDEDVEQAIGKIKQFLFKAQHPSGAWYGAYHTGPGDTDNNRNAWGPTAAAALALVVSGESPQREEIRKALQLLEENPIVGTYALSMRAHVWSYLPDQFRSLLSKDKDVMLNSLSPVPNNASNFNYYVYGSEGFEDQRRRIDNSTTQYGILALWQARKRGMNVPMAFWQSVAEGFLTMQQRDGGWSYSGAANTSQSMTLAGLTCMMVAQQELFRRESRPNDKVKVGIDNGLAYLDRNFNLKEMEVHGGASYAYYGYERVALASGRKYFGEHDWFEVIARKIIDRNGRYGDSIHSAAFDLMFLTRGRVPVWINKLEVPSATWNNRPNDIYFLNDFISNYREHEVNWQIANLDTMAAKDWIGAPLTWFSSDGAFQLTDQQTNKLKRYMDFGGTVIFNAEGKDRSFRASVEGLAATMYPHLKFEPMPVDHPMVNLLIGPDRPEREVPIRMLSNGARVLMIMPDEDWGIKFQAEDEPQPDRRGQEHWRFITNIYAVATDRGELQPRLFNPIVSRQSGRNKVGVITVMVPTFGDQALPETDVYSAMKNYMFNETGYDITVVSKPLTDLAATDPSLLHMVGNQAVTLSPAEREAVKAYIDAGGTVLMENLGGQGAFVESLRDELVTVLPAEDTRLSSAGAVPILTRSGLPDGAKINREVVYRRMTLERGSSGRDPLLRGYPKNDRFPILVSTEDLSLGMLGVRQYGINGYSVESSRNLMLNILLEAKQAHKGSEAAE